MELQQPPLPPDSGLFFSDAQPAFQHPVLPVGPPPPYMQPPLPAGPPPAHLQQQQQQPQPALAQQPAQQQQQGAKRKKRGRRGSGLEARARGMKQRGSAGGGGAAQQPGFFGQLPSLNDLRQENWRRTQQHYGGSGGSSRPFPGPLKQQHGPGRSGSHRRARSKAPKQPKMPLPTPRPVPLTPAVGNPLDTPANVGKPGSSVAPGKPEVEGLQEGLDWYGTNENSTALFLTGQQLTTSDSEGDGEGDDYGEGEGEDGMSDGEGGGGAGGGYAGALGAAGGQLDDAALSRHVKARLVEQEAYIAELEDQNLRLREQLEMVQQELDDLRARGGGGPADSEEGFAEHSEGSLPGDLSVMQQHHEQMSQHHHSQAL